MTWAVNVRVMTIRRLVFHVRRVDRDTTRFFWLRRINLIVRLRFAAKFRL